MNLTFLTFLVMAEDEIGGGMKNNAIFILWRHVLYPLVEIYQKYI